MLELNNASLENNVLRDITLAKQPGYDLVKNSSWTLSQLAKASAVLALSTGAYAVLRITGVGDTVVRWLGSCVARAGVGRDNQLTKINVEKLDVADLVVQEEQNWNLANSTLKLAGMDRTIGSVVYSNPVLCEVGFGLNALSMMLNQKANPILFGVSVLWCVSPVLSQVSWQSPVDFGALDGINGFKLDGGVAGDKSGYSVSRAGDINGDHIDDIIIGACSASPGGRTQAGRSYVVFGYNGIWEWNNTLDLTTLNGISGFKLDGEVAGDESGYSVGGAGDINGDRIDDIIIGAYLASPGGRTQAGRSYVVFGHNSSRVWDNPLNLTMLNGINGFKLDGEAASDSSGYSVNGAGDINGDHIDDIIISASGASPGGRSWAGRSYVVFGHNSSRVWDNPLNLTMLNGINGFKLDGETAGDESGTSVSGAGDINGDHIDDIIIGAYLASPVGKTYAGRSYVVFGHNSSWIWNNPFDLTTLNGVNGFKLDGEAYGDESGTSVSGAGDINGDHIDDIIIGAYWASPGGRSWAGRSYVVFGHNSGWIWNNTFDLAMLNGMNGFKLDGEVGDNSGISVSRAGDINGDSIDDIIIGAYSASPKGRANAGRSYVIFGHNSSWVCNNTLDLAMLNGMNGFKLDGEAGGVKSGFSVSRAGDINDDHIDDIIIGAYMASPEGRANAGRSYAVFGEATSKFKVGALLASQSGCCIIGIGQFYNFTFAVESFLNVEGGTFVYTAIQKNGLSLPNWLNFYPGNRTFIGTPVNAGDIGVLEIEITATVVNKFISISQNFPLNIIQTLSATNIAQTINYVEGKDYDLADITVTTPNPIVTSELILSDVTVGSLSTATNSRVASTYNSTTGVWRASGYRDNVNVLLASLKFIPAPNSYKNFYLAVRITDGYGQSLSSIISAIGSGSGSTISLIGGVVGGIVGAAIVSSGVVLGIYRYKKKKEQEKKRQQDIEMAEPKSWYFDLALRPLRSELEHYVLIKAGEVDNRKVVEAYQRCPVPGMDLKNVEIIYSPYLEEGFEARVKVLQKKDSDITFVPKWTRENNVALRSMIMERLGQMTKPYDEGKYPAVSLIPVWHGTKPEILDSIFKTGFANLAETDEGYFGKGLYFSYEARYAYQIYSKGALLVNWVSFYSAYPVVDGDMDKLYGKGSYTNYDAHFVPVKPAGSDPYEHIFYPCQQMADAAYHEIVVFESAQCLPRYLVELQPSLPKTMPGGGIEVSLMVSGSEVAEERGKLDAKSSGSDVASIRQSHKLLQQEQQVIAAAAAGMPMYPYRGFFDKKEFRQQGRQNDAIAAEIPAYPTRCFFDKTAKPVVTQDLRAYRIVAEKGLEVRDKTAKNIRSLIREELASVGTLSAVTSEAPKPR